MKRRLFILMLSGLSTFGSKAAEVAYADSAAFDVNDTTFLFPLTAGDDSHLYPDIRLSETSRVDGKAIFPKNTFKNVLAQQNANLANIQNEHYGNLRVVGFRYDPCFPGPQTDPGKCIQQIRLVVQPIDATDLGVKGAASDFSLHLLYDLGTGLPRKDDPIIRDLEKLKEESARLGAPTDGLPLQPHPGLKRELEKGQGARLSEMMRSFVLKYASAGRLRELTSTDGDGNEPMLGRWDFMGGAIRNGKWFPAEIPKVKKTIQDTDGVGGIFPDPCGGPRLLQPDESIGSNMTQIIDDIAAFLNPNLTNPKNTDCASCHIVSAKKVQLYSKVSENPSLAPSLNRSPSEYSVPAGYTAFVDTDHRPRIIRADFDNVRVMGYFSNTPQVSPIVAHSAAQVAETLNKIRGHSHGPNGLDCNIPEVKACFDGFDLQGNKVQKNSKECLAMCRKL